MTTATESRNNGSLVLPLLLLACLVAAGAWCVTSKHAWDKRGSVAVAVASSFSDDGRCTKGPSVSMRATSGVRMMICFVDPGKVQLHIQNGEGGGITDIPADEISQPESYLKSVIRRLGYQVEAAYGQLPQWFVDLIGGLQ